MPETLRIAVVTDIDHGCDARTPHGDAAGALLGRFRDWVNSLHPDVVVDLGDRIGADASQNPERLTREVASLFDDILPPCVHLAGDHELAGMTLSDAESAIGRRLTSHSRDVKGWHLTFWNAAVDTTAEDGFVLLPSDLDWLAEDLDDTELPCVVFSHIPLDAGSTAGPGTGGHAQGRPDHYRDAASARTMIEASGKVALCVAGHLHRYGLSTLGGVHYLTLQSLAAPAGAMTLIEIGERIVVDARGDEPMRLDLSIRPSTRMRLGLPPATADSDRTTSP